PTHDTTAGTGTTSTTGKPTATTATTTATTALEYVPGVPTTVPTGECGTASWNAGVVTFLEAYNAGDFGRIDQLTDPVGLFDFSSMPKPYGTNFASYSRSLFLDQLHAMWNGGVRVDIGSLSSNISGAGTANGGAVNSNAGSVKFYLECGS